MQVGVYAAPTNSQMLYTMRKWAILPRRNGGLVPGISPVAPAAYVASAMSFEGFVRNFNKQMANRKEEVPLGIHCPLKRMGGRSSKKKGGGS